MNFTFQKFEITLVIILFEYSKVKVQIGQQNKKYEFDLCRLTQFAKPTVVFFGLIELPC